MTRVNPMPGDRPPLVPTGAFVLLVALLAIGFIAYVLATTPPAPKPPDLKPIPEYRPYLRGRE